jgi:excisionase family DNA binding protein
MVTQPEQHPTPDATRTPEAAPRLVLNIDEVAVALRVSPRTIRELVAHGHLKSFRIGRRVLVSVEACAAFVHQREAEASA